MELLNLQLQLILGKQAAEGRLGRSVQSRQNSGENERRMAFIWEALHIPPSLEEEGEQHSLLHAEARKALQNGWTMVFLQWAHLGTH